MTGFIVVVVVRKDVKGEGRSSTVVELVVIVVVVVAVTAGEW